MNGENSKLLFFILNRKIHFFSKVPDKIPQRNGFDGKPNVYGSKKG